MMKFTFLGTAAAEGLPAVFCQCEVCQISRRLGGKHLRTRSQALVNDDLLIDFPVDTYMHMLRHGIDLASIKHILITHTHSDHLAPKDFEWLQDGFSHLKDTRPVTIYGSEAVGKIIRPLLANLQFDKKNKAAFQEVEPFKKFVVKGYTITPLKAVHDPNSGPVMYSISQGNKSLLYAHDTGYFAEEVWDYFEKKRPYFHLVTLDCTEGHRDIHYNTHMNLEQNIKVRDRMLEMGCADKDTKFYCNHFSHNGGHVLYDEFKKIAKKAGLHVSYDGLQVKI